MSLSSTTVVATEPGRLQRSRLVTSAVFVVHAALFASWTPHIPAVKAGLGTGDALLGVALLGAPAGSVVAMITAGCLISRWGSTAVIRLTLTGYCLAPVLIGFSHSVSTLFGALFCWGAFQGSLDVAMNSQAGSVERWYGRSIFSSFHACWSLGGFFGTGLGAMSIALGIPLRWHLLAMGLIIAATVLPLTRWLLPANADPANVGNHSLPRPNLTLIGLGAIALLGLLSEGAAADWSAVYLHEALALPASAAGSGYAAFALAMFTGRIIGDRIITRIGPRNAVRAGTLIAGVAFGTALLIGRPATSIAGFALLGLGLGLVIPSIFSASTRVPGSPPAASLAFTTAFGWAGFVCGPPLIGFFSGLFSLPVALGIVATCCLLMTALASVVEIRPQLQQRPDNGN